MSTLTATPIVSQNSADIEAEIARLREENARLKATLRVENIRANSRYAELGAYTFLGKSEVRRQNAQPWPCGCQPYREILTRGRWRYLGYYVRRGEAAEYMAGRKGMTPVYCAHQVASMIDGSAHPSTTRIDTWEPEDINAIPF